MTQYLLDANVFIQAKNLQYGMDFCPAFWEWLIERNAASQVFSIEKVGDELAAGNDDLSTWAAPLGSTFFLPPTQAMIASLTQLSQWATTQQYRPAAVTAFLQDTDYYLVGSAHAGGYTVVTHEVISHGISQVKIPNACIGVNVKCVTPYEMLRIERARFVLGRALP